jgi:twitching motility protein PilT
MDGTEQGGGGGTEIRIRALLEEMIARGRRTFTSPWGSVPSSGSTGTSRTPRWSGPLTPKDTLTMAYSILTEQQKKRFETDDELDFSFGIQNLSRFRGNCFKQRGCIAMALRQIPYDLHSLDQLGLPAMVKKMAERPRGLVLVTGPTGSGKSTTLAAMLDKINQERKGHILTIEDPSSSCITTRGAR